MERNQRWKRYQSHETLSRWNIAWCTISLSQWTKTQWGQILLEVAFKLLWCFHQGVRWNHRRSSSCEYSPVAYCKEQSLFRESKSLLKIWDKLILIFHTHTKRIYHIVMSTNMCNYSENEIFWFSKSQIVTCRNFLLGKKLFYLLFKWAEKKRYLTETWCVCQVAGISKRSDNF